MNPKSGDVQGKDEEAREENEGQRSFSDLDSYTITTYSEQKVAEKDDGL